MLFDIRCEHCCIIYPPPNWCYLAKWTVGPVLWTTPVLVLHSLHPFVKPLPHLCRSCCTAPLVYFVQFLFLQMGDSPSADNFPTSSISHASLAPWPLVCCIIDASRNSATHKLLCSFNSTLLRKSGKLFLERIATKSSSPRRRGELTGDYDAWWRGVGMWGSSIKLRGVKKITFSISTLRKRPKGCSWC